MNPTVPVGPQTRKALHHLGGLCCEVMHADGDVDFWVSARRQTDGSLKLEVVHPSGSFEFMIPRDERASEVGRVPVPESKGHA